MDRRQFFRFGISGLRDAASKKVPDAIKPTLGRTALDVSILTDRPREAERLAEELLREHFSGAMLRLRQSELVGTFSGGVLLFEGNHPRNFHDGISLFHGALRQLENDLGLPSLQHDPTLVRFVNQTPPFSRSVEVFHRDRLLLALPLNEDGAFEFPGTQGPMSFTIKNGRFSVTASACRYGTCIAHPAIQTPGQRISCVPNEMSAVIGAILG
jgi:hypothetical protein